MDINQFTPWDPQHASTSPHERTTIFTTIRNATIDINRIDICQTAGRYADPHLKHAKTHPLQVIKYLHHKQHYCFRIRRPNTNRDMTRYSPYLVWVLNSLNIISIISIRLSTIIRKFRFWTTTFAKPKYAGMNQQDLWFVWLTLSICYYHLFPPSTKYISCCGSDFEYKTPNGMQGLPHNLADHTQHTPCSDRRRCSI